MIQTHKKLLYVGEISLFLSILNGGEWGGGWGWAALILF